MLRLAILIAALVLVAPVAAQTVPGRADAYLDAQAGVLVARARAASDSANAAISGYDAVARQRVTAGVRLSGRLRPIYRQELAASLAWREGGPHRVEVLGAREAQPIIRSGTRVPGGLASEIDDLLFDPTELMLLRMGAGLDNRDGEGEDDGDPDAAADGSAEAADPADGLAGDDGAGQPADGDPNRAPRGGRGRGFIHPLERGSEDHYRFRSGEETAIRLQDGRTIRLIELQVLPRQSSSRLLRGSIWLEQESYLAVRGVFTLASPMRVSIPPAGWVPVPTVQTSFEIQHMSVEYSLWDNRWWLPRLVSFEGSGGALGVTASLIYEELYGEYRIYSSGAPPDLLAPPDTTRFSVAVSECDADEGEECVGYRVARRTGGNPQARLDRPQVVVLIPRDSVSMVRSRQLPRSIYGSSARLTDERTRREMASVLDAGAFASFLQRSPRARFMLIDGSLLRFNRVEGLTLGSTAMVELDPFAATLSGWMGLADSSPSGRLTLTRTGYARRETLDLYHRVEAFSPEDRPFSLGSSVGAFFFGRDEGDYFRSTGVSLARAYGDRIAPGVTVRAYAERHREVETRTNASLPYWISDREFRPNPAADRANQIGAEARFALSRGLDPTGFRFSWDVDARGETGTYRFVRASTGAVVAFPIPGRLLGAVEAGVGSSLGDVPVQRLWYVGGPATVRGIAPEDRVGGEAFWRARGEIGTRNPGARLVVFGDAGMAAPRDALGIDPTLLSVGAGISLMDGLFRADVARALRGGDGWSVRLRLDAVM